ncbi:hypothetical protein F4820DRAFT_368466 [Hypoxylon rubiginosum]|uniref:Uncharacterized protein n=1 Tax=Hypoxylon rubiginosum TaxID=110542 RepID=A0ACB9YW81_9PEZI|nr:hypothetical protein F4820DRAFT_368466 [Hypoxylon rubiginosum]
MASLISILLISLLTQHTTGLQVTPNSPCASLCVDSTGLDFSDPNSSTTGNGDISCYDSEYSSSAKGQKFQNCMTCLQSSAFSQGSESDQSWFLYNLRYTFDYCIFGFPNATVASTPCSTSFACGDLRESLTDDNLNPEDNGYSYCPGTGPMSDDMVSKCMSCVSASDDQDYLANYLVALDAGCKQRPPTGMVIGLNDTVFSKNRVTAVDPTAEDTTNEKQSTMSVGQIVGIVAGAIVAVLAVAGFLFVRCRKRRNRSLIVGDTRNVATGQKSRHRPASSLSFRCQTHLTPKSPAFFPNPSDGIIEEEKPYASPFSALGSHPISPESPKQATWQSQSGNPRLSSFARGDNKMLPLHNIATAIPAIPDNVHYSTSPKAPFFSPTDEPASTTSTKSTSQLLPLRQYNPAEYGVTSPQLGSTPDGTFSSPTSGSTSSPLMSRAWDQRTPAWDLPPRGSSRPAGVGAWERVAAGVANKNRRTSNNGSPVETTHINFNYPPPPARR